MTSRLISVADTRLDYGNRYRAYCRNVVELEAFIALVSEDSTATDAELVEVTGKHGGGDRLSLAAWRAALVSMRAGRGNPTRWKKRLAKEGGMRFDLRTLDEIALDAERETRQEAERDALAEWLALPADERERRRELADALTPEEFR